MEPVWDNSNEYKGLFSPDFNQDLEQVERLLREIDQLNLDIVAGSPKLIPALQEVSRKDLQVFIILRNLATFSQCEKSIDSKNEQAHKAAAKIEGLWSTYMLCKKRSDLFLETCDDSILAEYLSHPDTQDEAFEWADRRKLRDHLLSEAEEKTISQFATYAHRNWGELYSNISGDLRVRMTSKGEMGLAQAVGLLRGPDEKIRREAWEGIQAAWKSVEIPAAAVLNNLAGYRLELYKKRSHRRPMNFMVKPLHEARIEMQTLDAMLGAIEEKIEVPRRALRAIAQSLGKKQIDPWDILAPAPQTKKDSQYSFSDALAMITEAFASVDKGMGDFVQMMAKNGWIEAAVRPHKSSGAYCTGFWKSRTPRVFQTYMGSMKDVSTLAHELGHAYHSWVMRDMSPTLTWYPMTLAETASIFSETLLSERLLEKADSAAKLNTLFEDASDAVSMLINIPARYEFEKNFYVARAQGPLSVNELNDLTDQAWRKWYGEGISQTEKQYWMTKMHFSFSDISFYNYPYTFGYLFGLGIYSLRDKLGTAFHAAYVDILRDSGRMTAEELVQKHLGMNIRQKDFWLQSLNIIEKKVQAFESLIN